MAAGSSPAIGKALRSAHRRGKADHDLDQPELGRFGGEDDVAGQRKFEGGGQGEAVSREDDRKRHSLDPVDQAHQLFPETIALGSAQALELLDVDSTRDDFAFGPDQESPGRVVQDLVEGVDQVHGHGPVEEIQRRRVERDHGHGTVPLDGYE